MTLKTGFGLVFLAAMVSVPQPAVADDCLDELRTLFGNEMGAFNRKPYRSVKTVYGEDGKVQLIFDNIVENPLETISGNRGGPFGLVVDQEVWTGPTQEGPWTPLPTPPGFPSDRKAGYDAQQAQMLASMGDAVCHGEVDLEGAHYIHYEYKVLPPEDKTALPFWASESNRIWLDTETKQVARWEQADFEVSFLKGISKERHVMVFEYDEAIRVDPPQ